MNVEMTLNNLSSLGWTAKLQQIFDSTCEPSMNPARVASVAGKRCRLAGYGASAWAECAGSFLNAMDNPMDLPTVGDWVAVSSLSGTPMIHAVLPRRSFFVRKASGNRLKPQAVAANIDTVLVFTALGGDWSPRRIERYLAAVWVAGAQPMIVVNKSDLGDDTGPILDDLEAIAPDVPSTLISVKDGHGVEFLEERLTPGTTVALVGSSGVGKSSLINRLMGDDVQETGAISEEDGKGRHTTTRRELLVTKGGLILIDTPGLREMGLWEAREGLSTVFADIETLAKDCYFKNCAHQDEPDCAVIREVKEGSLNPRRLEHYLRLRKELDSQDQRTEEQARQPTKQQVRQISRKAKRMRDFERKERLKDD